MKKLLIIPAALVALVIFIVPISILMVKQGFRNRDKAWAPKMVYTGGRIQMRLLRYGAATRVLERAVEVFPDSDRVDEMYYQIGLCYQKIDQPTVAVRWYKEFVTRWPRHMWADQARRRLAELEVHDS